jgi:hypothetical protein
MHVVQLDVLITFVCTFHFNNLINLHFRIFDILFYETCSTLTKVAFSIPSPLIRQLGLCVHVIQLDVLITFVYTFHFNNLINLHYQVIDIHFYETFSTLTKVA